VNIYIYNISCSYHQWP